MPHPLDLAKATELTSFFKAMSDPTRIRIISLLTEPNAEYAVQELADALEMSHSAISHQLRLLRQLRVVKARRDGRQRFYSLDDDHVKEVYERGLDHMLHG